MLPTYHCLHAGLGTQRLEDNPLFKGKPEGCFHRAARALILIGNVCSGKEWCLLLIHY